CLGPIQFRLIQSAFPSIVTRRSQRQADYPKGLVNPASDLIDRLARALRSRSGGISDADEAQHRRPLRQPAELTDLRRVGDPAGSPDRAETERLGSEQHVLGRGGGSGYLLELDNLLSSVRLDGDGDHVGCAQDFLNHSLATGFGLDGV